MSYAAYTPHVSLGAALPSTATSPVLNAGITALRAQSCYSQELADCINTTQPSPVKDCEVMRAGYKVDAKAMDAAAESVPFCQASSGPSIGSLIAVGAFGLAAGLLLSSVLR